MESVFRRSTFLTAVGICIAVVTLLAGVGGVRGQGGVTFGIRPAETGEQGNHRNADAHSGEEGGPPENGFHGRC